MRIKLACLAILSALSLGGCVASLHAVAPETGGLFDPSVPGKWREVGENGDGTVYTVEKQPPDGYRITFPAQAKDLTVAYRAHVFRLGEALFCDISFDEALVNGVSVHADDLGVYAQHAFGRVWVQKDEIRLRSLDERWLNKALETKQVTLRFERGEGSGIDILLTGPAEEIRAFAQKYADDKDVFSEENVFRRVK